MVFREREFLRMYRGGETFLSEGRKYYEAFLQLLKDEALLEHIRFCNDVHKIPPLKSYILYERNIKKSTLFNEKLDSEKTGMKIKQGLGACFGYLYRVLYKEEGYEAVSAWFADEKTGLRSASYFIKK